MRGTGDLSRDGYWRLMQRHCSLLLDLGSILDATSVECVCVSHEGVIVTLTDGSRLHWDSQEVREPASLLVADGMYESGETEVLRRLCTQVDLFIDVGANTGYYPIILSRVNESMRIVAVEPVHATRMKLVTNLRLNNLEDRVLVVGAALADHAGETTMFLPEATGSVGSSLRDLHPDEVSGIESVEVTTLDEVLATTECTNLSTLVKIDVEGAEGLVLTGAQRLLSSGALFVVELSRKWLAEFGSSATEIVQLFRGYGYHCYAIDTPAANEALVSLVSEIDGETQAVNFLFIPIHRSSSLVSMLA